MSTLSQLVEINKQLEKKAISLNCKEKKSQRLCWYSPTLNNAVIIVQKSSEKKFYWWLSSHAYTPKCLQKLMPKVLPQKTTNTIKFPLDAMLVNKKFRFN